MTTIPSILATGHYSLENQTGAKATDKTMDTLAQMLKTADTTGGTESNSFMLDLSEEAKAYLNNWGSQSSTTSGEKKEGDARFALSRLQQQKVAHILSKYKDEPFTQETFNKIQDELDDAGLSAERLAAIEQAHSVNPMQMLMNALNGIDGGEDALSSGATATTLRKEKSNNYIKDLITQWSDISTTIAEDTEEPTLET